MPRTTSTLPDDLHQLIEGSVDAGIFENKSDAIRHALRDYFEEHEDARLAAAIHLYDNDEISLGKAARLSGVSRFDMPDILREHDVDAWLRDPQCSGRPRYARHIRAPSGVNYPTLLRSPQTRFAR